MIDLRDADTGAELIPLSNASYLPHRPAGMAAAIAAAERIGIEVEFRSLKLPQAAAAGQD